MSESSPEHLRHPSDRAVAIERLHRVASAVFERDDARMRLKVFTGERLVKMSLADKQKIKIREFPFSGFEDHNFRSANERQRMTITTPEQEYTLWELQPEKVPAWLPGRTVYPDLVTPEIYVSELPLPSEVSTAIDSAKMGSIGAKVFNHLVTFGPFIGGVEEQRRQRLFNTIHHIKTEAGVVRAATEDEIGRLTGLLGE